VDLRRYLEEKREIVDSALEKWFPPLENDQMDVKFLSSLHLAIRHSLFAGGKRIRPILCLAAYEVAGGKGDGVLPVACALEMIHTYSLIHDDLPSIDNDDYRRGKPTCHKVFGEAMAILAGDALLTEAFNIMTARPPGENRGEGWALIDVVNRVARAAGINGMVGGQVVDIESEGKEVDLPTLQFMHTHKTGAMLLVSVQTGARLGGATEEGFKALTRYGERIGLAFQIADDVLDIEGKVEILGKAPGSDRSKKKATYPSVVGLEESKRRAAELVERAVEALSHFGSEADPLREIARFIVTRNS
jgi:geranylgeranyl diphosphate synthase, type II